MKSLFEDWTIFNIEATTDEINDTIAEIDGEHVSLYYIALLVGRIISLKNTAIDAAKYFENSSNPYFKKTLPDIIQTSDNNAKTFISLIEDCSEYDDCLTRCMKIIDIASAIPFTAEGIINIDNELKELLDF